MRKSIACPWRRGGSICTLVLWLVGLAACNTETTQTVSSGLSVRYLTACTPRRVEQLTIEALGDFATSESSFAAIDVGRGIQTVFTLPLTTRLYRVKVNTDDFDGVGIGRAAVDDSNFNVLILPRAEPCLAISAADLVRPGAAVALTGDDDLLVAGGQTNATVSSDVHRLRASLGRLDRVEPDLFVPRHGAAAVRSGAETWILGGVQALTNGAPALDSFERYDTALDALSGLGRLAVPRSELAALALEGGDVLIAGGRGSQGGEMLDSLEILRVGTEQAETLKARLPWGLSSGRLLARDDGTVVVLGAGPSSLLFALFDPVTGAMDDEPMPDLVTRPELVVTLPGARVGLLELDDGGATSGVLVVRLSGGERVRLDGALTSFAGLTAARATTLHDGQILLTGLRNGQATARVIDPGTLSVRALALPAVPLQLLVRDDGAVLLLADDSLSLLRLDARTPYDNPGGTLLASDTSVLALDARGRFTREGLVLRAEHNGARLDLAGLSYGRVVVELETRGELALLMRLVTGPERSIQLGPHVLGPALCTLHRPKDAPVRITRDAETLRLESGGVVQQCRLDGLTGRIRLGMRALERGAEVRELVVTRRE